ncbi:hypothetical protein Bca4012_082834 [Brassica carinata]
MEIIGTSNIEDGEDDTAMMIVEQEDDLLGEEFMDIEAAAIMSGSRSGIPLGLLNKKAEFLRRGSPKLCRSSSKEPHRSGRQNIGPTDNAKGSTCKSHALEGSKNTSKHHPGRQLVGTVERRGTTSQFDALRRCVRNMAQNLYSFLKRRIGGCCCKTFRPT